MGSYCRNARFFKGRGECVWKKPAEDGVEPFDYDGDFEESEKKKARQNGLEAESDDE